MPDALTVLRDADDFVVRHIYALEDDTIEELFRLYVRGLGRMYLDLDQIWSRYVIGSTWSTEDGAFRQRHDELIALLLAVVAMLAARSEDITLLRAIEAYKSGAVGRNYVLDQLRIGDSGFVGQPEATIRAILMQPYRGNTFVDRFRMLPNQFERTIRVSLIESQIKGETIFQAQERIARALGIDITDVGDAGSKAHRSNFFRTQNIARTELLRSSNLGAMETYRANADILSGWEWLTAKDDRVCPFCAPLDGQVYSFNSPKTPPPEHPQCRCTPIPVLINKELQNRIVGERETFTAWAQRRGLSRNAYGQAYDFRGQDAPQLELQT